jgi:hypothetical protein
MLCLSQVRALLVNIVKQLQVYMCGTARVAEHDHRWKDEEQEVWLEIRLHSRMAELRKIRAS